MHVQRDRWWWLLPVSRPVSYAGLHAITVPLPLCQFDSHNPLCTEASTIERCKTSDATKMRFGACGDLVLMVTSVIHERDEPVRRFGRLETANDRVQHVTGQRHCGRIIVISSHWYDWNNFEINLINEILRRTTSHVVLSCVLWKLNV